MKNLIILITLIFVFPGCDLFDKSEDYGVCSAELFEKVNEQNTIRVFVIYNMPFQLLVELTEEERETYLSDIQDMHDAFLKELEGYNTYGHTKYEFSPQMAIRLDASSLKVTCNSKLVSSVVEVGRGTTQKRKEDNFDE